MADDVKSVETATPQPAKEMLPFNIREERDEANNINRIYDATTGVEIGWKIFDGQFYDHWFGKYPAKFYTMSASVEAAVNDALDPAEVQAFEPTEVSEGSFEQPPELSSDQVTLEQAIEASKDFGAADEEENGLEADATQNFENSDNGAEAPCHDDVAEASPETAADTQEASEPCVEAEAGASVEVASGDSEYRETHEEPQTENPLHGALSLVMAMHGGQPIASGQLNAADRVFSQLLVAIAERKLNSLYFTTTDGSNIGWDKPETMAGVA